MFRFKEKLVLPKMEDHKTVFKRLKDVVEKSKYQKELHFSSDNKEETELIRTHFLNIQRKETWSYRCNLKLDCNGDISDPSNISYRVRTLPYHGLIYSVLAQKLPIVKANRGFEICWCPNVGSNIVKSAEFKVNDSVWQTLDSVYFDDYHTKISKDEHLDIHLGNVPELRNWSKELPSYMTMFYIPWFYSLHTSKMFPLYNCGKEDRIEHVLSLRRNLKDLLMIRSVDTGEIIPFDEACITVDNFNLPTPEMRGEYVMMSDMECEHNRCNSDKYHSDIFDIDNIKIMESDNTYGVNSTVSIKIKDMPFPVHTIHWKASNVTAEANNYLSNYTTCSFDHTKGESPIRWASLSCPQGILFKNLESYICEKIVPYKNFGKLPKYSGYGCWTNSVTASDPLYPKPGIKLDEGELTFRLEDPNNSESKDKYRVHARAVYTYRITFKDYPKTEAERNSKGIEVEVSGDL
jgi:hypothetical protein